ncbi:unnamed protein product, partial [Symbiodinium sp. KB8]
IWCHSFITEHRKDRTERGTSKLGGCAGRALSQRTASAAGQGRGPGPPTLCLPRSRNHAGWSPWPEIGLLRRERRGRQDVVLFFVCSGISSAGAEGVDHLHRPRPFLGRRTLRTTDGEATAGSRQPLCSGGGSRGGVARAAREPE